LAEPYTLFSAQAPLAERLRPVSFEDFEGNAQIVALKDRLAGASVIFYGPPGCGKTTLAHLLARHSGLPVASLSAVSAGVKEVRDVITQARRSGRTILIIDEIHRFNKGQQDALLEAVENGTILLLGATTENPSFALNAPLLSRCQVFKLTPVNTESLRTILQRALDTQLPGVHLTAEAQEMLVSFAAGDARKMLRVLELVAGSGSSVTPEHLASILAEFARRYDRSGENHYDYSSALIKSLRGSDPDAALLYLACMLEGGEAPAFIARRLIIFAAEDIGNASPQALDTAVSASLALERIGMPEGRIILAQAVTFLASCPKSNAAYLAIDAALDFVRQRQVLIPDHLRNAPTATHKAEGAGKNYKYPHDFPGHYVDQSYMPDGVAEQFYFPTDQGHEARLRDRLQSLQRRNRKY
jgi:putative ATPase